MHRSHHGRVQGIDVERQAGTHYLPCKVRIRHHEPSLVAPSLPQIEVVVRLGVPVPEPLLPTYRPHVMVERVRPCGYALHVPFVHFLQGQGNYLHVVRDVCPFLVGQDVPRFAGFQIVYLQFLDGQAERLWNGCDRKGYHLERIQDSTAATGVSKALCCRTVPSLIRVM